MFRKGLIALVFAGGLAVSAVAADISIRIGPPRSAREMRMARPSRNHVWISGYQRWNGNAYAWSPGRWEQPPRRRARWQSHRWKHQRNGWVLVEGRWR
jgi:hypothetical protein